MRNILLVSKPLSNKGLNSCIRYIQLRAKQTTPFVKQALTSSPSLYLSLKPWPQALASSPGLKSEPQIWDSSFGLKP